MRIPLWSSRPPLPAQLLGAWESLRTCAELLEGGRRVLLGTLPVGRVEPAPVAVGTAALRAALHDLREPLQEWRSVDPGDLWETCREAVDDADRLLDELDRVSASTEELDDILDLVRTLMDGLDAFADAEEAFRRKWRVPRAAGLP